VPRTRTAKPVVHARLTRARVVDVGLELLGKNGRQSGAGGLSMRVLAEALGTAPMSLYRHVRSKDDLLGAIVGLVLERLDLDVPARGPWTDRAAAWMHSLRNQLRRSPAVVSILMQHGRYTPALLRATNTLLRILRDAGFEGRAAVRASREITWSTLGFVSAEIRGPAFSSSFYAPALGGPDGGGAKGLPAEDVAEVAAQMPHFLTRDLDEVFAAIVRHLLAGLATEVTARAARRGGRR
jgi:AcrR family transcriptional regulator